MATLARKSPSPEWVETWLKLPFYSDKCTKHPNKYNTVYCGACKDDPVCELCWKHDADQHDGDKHPILHVRKASGRAAIDIEEIGRFLDVSKIQIYSINGKCIVFLNPNMCSQGTLNVKPNCHTCLRKLICENQRFGYRFCSIACKIRSKEGNVEIEKKSDDREITEVPMIKVEVMIKRKMAMINDQCNMLSLRKRSRKEIPRRAPFK